MGRKRKIIRIAIGIGCGVGLVWGLSVLTRSGSSRYDEFLRAKRIADFAVRCQNSSLGRLFPQSFRHRFVERFREKAQSQRISLYRSNSLSWLKVYAPESPERNRQLREVQLKAINSHWFLEIDTADEDTITFHCLPGNEAELQSRFSYVTHYVPRGPLTRLAGFRQDDEPCARLPDGTVVDLAALQTWLNQSIAAGWRVGVSISNGLFIGSRQMAVVTGEQSIAKAKTF